MENLSFTHVPCYTCLSSLHQNSVISYMNSWSYSLCILALFLLYCVTKQLVPFLPLGDITSIIEVISPSAFPQIKQVVFYMSLLKYMTLFPQCFNFSSSSVSSLTF